MKARASVFFMNVCVIGGIRERHSDGLLGLEAKWKWFEEMEGEK